MVLRERLGGLGLTVVPNVVDDAPRGPYACKKSYLGAIMTLLHGAGLEGEELRRRASDVHEDLAAHDDDALGDALRNAEAPDLHEMMFLALAKRVFAACDERNCPAVLIMKAGEDGSPLLYDPTDLYGGDTVDPATVPPDTVVFMESHGRFEAVANTSGRPWSAVLAQLSMSPDKPEHERQAAWIQHCIGALKEVKVTTVNNLQSHEHRLKRSEQLELELGDVREEWSPSKKAQAMAEAQAVVDMFWAALEQRPVTQEWWHVESNDGGQMHLLEVNLGDGSLLGEIHVRDSRIISLHVRLNQGDIVAQYEHPWRRCHGSA